MWRLTVIVISTSAFLSAHQSVPSNRTLFPCSQAALPELFRDSNLDLKQRREFANHLADPLRQLEQAIPSLSPNEREWLTTELKSPGRRSLAAAMSIENTKLETKRSAADLLQFLEPLGGGNLSAQQEVALWAHVATRYPHLQDGIVALVEGKVIDPGYLRVAANSGTVDHEVLERTCDAVNLGILNRIVIPYLQNQLDK